MIAVDRADQADAIYGIAQEFSAYHSWLSITAQKV